MIASLLVPFCDTIFSEGSLYDAFSPLEQLHPVVFMTFDIGRRALG